MYNEVITLIGEVVTANEYGDRTVVQTRRDVYACLMSITQSEFYQASAVGLKPQLKFVIADFLDWHGEDVVAYKAYGETTEQIYRVLRTYRNGNALELVVERSVDK